LLYNVNDIVKNLNWDLQEKEVQQSLFNSLTNEEELIIEVLEQKALHVDEIKQKLQCQSSKIAKHLLQIEFKDIIIPFSVKIYKRIM
jgi:predicted Rossmann fold nucleotide-binding protein DprA/Smf involved in DNA uptake